MVNAIDERDALRDADLLIDMYRTMATIRACEAHLMRGLRAGEVTMSYWPVEGQEAMSTGAMLALDPGDRVVTTYRCLGDAIALGVELEPLIAELLGKGTGLSKGKAGAMGVTAPELGLMMSTGIVGAGPPVAVGLALAAHYLSEPRVALASFGDGATSIGAMHEAMNMAALWSLPTIFFCQNNHWGERTPVAEYTKTEHLADRAAAYGMPGITVDGRDPLAVHDAVKEAATRARAGGGPTFIEAMAWRLQGHLWSDPMAYVDKAELEAARELDPLPAYRARLLDAGIEEAALAAIEDEAAGRVLHAYEAAVAAGGAAPEELHRDLYTGIAVDGTRSAKIEPETPFDGTTEELGVARAINKALDLAMDRDPTIVLLGEDIGDPGGGVFSVTSGLQNKYGDARVRCTPIAETSILGAALGGALGGIRPVAEVMFMDFLGVCLDQLVNQAAKVRYMSGGRLCAPLTIRTVVGNGAGPQHSQSLEAWLMHMPGLKVVFPGSSADAFGLMLSCLESDDPCVFIESMALLFGTGRGPVPTNHHTIPIGKADIKRSGTDATVITYGPMVGRCLAAADELAEQGLDVEVVDLRTLLPLDSETILTSCAKTKRVLVAHDAVEFCGPGAEIAALINAELFGQLEAPVARLGASFTPVPRSPELNGLCRADSARISAALKELAR